MANCFFQDNLELGVYSNLRLTIPSFYERTGRMLYSNSKRKTGKGHNRDYDPH